MASGFIAVAIAHDYTCPKGEEWIFKGLPKEGDANKTEPSANIDEPKVGFIEVFLWVLGLLIIGSFVAFSIWLIIGF